MDHTVANQTRLFDDLLAVLERHRDEPGAEEVRGYLNAAKVNYVQRSVYHLVVSLALALDRLMALPPADELRNGTTRSHPNIRRRDRSGLREDVRIVAQISGIGRSTIEPG